MCIRDRYARARDHCICIVKPGVGEGRRSITKVVKSSKAGCILIAMFGGSPCGSVQLIIQWKNSDRLCLRNSGLVIANKYQPMRPARCRYSHLRRELKVWSQSAAVMQRSARAQRHHRQWLYAPAAQAPLCTDYFGSPALRRPSANLANPIGFHGALSWRLERRRPGSAARRSATSFCARSF